MPMVRVSENTHKLLQSIAKEFNESMQEVISQSIEQYRRKKILEETNKAYSLLREDREAWNEELREREQWDGVLLDNLEKDDEGESDSDDLLQR